MKAGGHCLLACFFQTLEVWKVKWQWQWVWQVGVASEWSFHDPNNMVCKCVIVHNHLSVRGF